MDNTEQHLSQDEESHGFNLEMGQTWIYPTNYPIRDYQYNIVSEALFTNTMVCLPTGLGKTFIAAVVMYNYFRWYPNGKIIFMAPTKPLVKQQVEACYNIMAIPKEATAELTGTTAQTSRDEIWEEKRVFFITPQVLQNDLERIARLGRKIKCLVFDEAHKARGNFAYCEVIKKISPISKHFRVLALTATPGSTVTDVVKVCSDLLISHLEIRTEDSQDVAQFVFKKNIETIVVPLDAKLKQVLDDYNMVLDRFVRVLVNHRVIQGNCSAITKGRMFYIKKEYEEKNAYTRGPQHNEIMKTLNICLILYHAHEVLTKHGLRGFLTFFKEHEDKPLLKKIYEIGTIVEDVSSYLGEIPDVDMLPDGTIPEIPKDTKFGHPKFYKLAEVLNSHFTKLNEKGQNDRVIVFCEYRESVIEAYTVLLMYRPLVKPRIFLGQATITQKQQLNVLQSFRRGDCNTLVSTSIGEEGLDIGDVNLVVCFDISNKSSIRMIQRMGRTGRKREGNVIMLVTEGKEQQLLRECLAHKDYMINALKTSKELHKSLYKNSARMIPEGIKPICNKIFITVEKDKKNGSLLNLFDKMRESSGDFHYDDVQIVNFTDRIPKMSCLFNKNVEEVLGCESDDLICSVETNRVFQSSYGEIGSSEDTKAMVSLLEFSNSLRYNIPSTQSSIINKQSMKSDKFKQSDIRSMFQKQNLSQMDFQNTINIVTASEQHIEHKELQSELNNYLSQFNFDCKICNNLFMCNMYKHDTILEPWIVPENNVLNSLTKDSLRHFVEDLNVEKMVIDDDIMKEFEIDEFEMSGNVSGFELMQSPEKVCEFNLPNSAKKVLLNHSNSPNLESQKKIYNVFSGLNNLDCNKNSESKTNNFELNNLRNCEHEKNVGVYKKLENIQNSPASDSQNSELKDELSILENRGGFSTNMFSDLTVHNENKTSFNKKKQNTSFMPIPKTMQMADICDNNALKFFKMNDLSDIFESECCTSEIPKGFVKKFNNFEHKKFLQNHPIKSKVLQNEYCDMNQTNEKKEIQTNKEEKCSKILADNLCSLEMQAINEQTPNKKTSKRMIIESPDIFDSITSDDSNQSEPKTNNNKPEHIQMENKQLNDSANIQTLETNNTNTFKNSTINKQCITKNLNEEKGIQKFELNKKLNKSICFNRKQTESEYNKKPNSSISINDICGDDLLGIINFEPEEKIFKDMNEKTIESDLNKSNVLNNVRIMDSEVIKTFKNQHPPETFDEDNIFFNVPEVNVNPVREGNAKEKLRCVNIEKLIETQKGDNDAGGCSKGLNSKLSICDSIKNNIKTNTSLNLKRKITDEVCIDDENNYKFKEDKRNSDDLKNIKESSSTLNFNDIFGDDFSDLTKPIETKIERAAKRPKFTRINNDRETISHNVDKGDIFEDDFINFIKPVEKKQILSTAKNTNNLCNMIEHGLKAKKTMNINSFGDDFFGLATQKSTSLQTDTPLEEEEDLFTISTQTSSLSYNFNLINTDKSRNNDPIFKRKQRFIKKVNTHDLQKIKQKKAMNPHDDNFTDDFFTLSTQKSTTINDISYLKSPVKNCTSTIKEITLKNDLNWKTPTSCEHLSTNNVSQKLTEEDDLFQLNTQKINEGTDCFNSNHSNTTVVNKILITDDDLFAVTTQKSVDDVSNLKTQINECIISKNGDQISDDDIFSDGDFNLLKESENNQVSSPTNQLNFDKNDLNKLDNIKMIPVNNIGSSNITEDNKDTDINSLKLKCKRNLKNEDEDKEFSTLERNSEPEINSDSDTTVVFSPNTISLFTDLKKIITISDDDDDDSQQFQINYCSFNSKSKRENLQNTKKNCDNTKIVYRSDSDHFKEHKYNKMKTGLEKLKQNSVLEKRKSDEDFETPSVLKNKNVNWKNKSTGNENKRCENFENRPQLEKLTRKFNDSGIDDILKKYNTSPIMNKTSQFSKNSKLLSNPKKSSTLMKSKYSPTMQNSKTTELTAEDLSPILNKSQFSPILNNSQFQNVQLSPVLNKSQVRLSSSIVSPMEVGSKKRPTFQSPESPIFKGNRLKRAKLHFDSPNSIKNLNSGIHISSDDDFEQPYVKLKSPSKKRKKRRNINNFFETEAKLSSNDEASEDEESGSSLDVMEESFVNDETQDLGNKTMMHAHYLQTAKSPMYRRGAYKIPQLPNAINKNIFSQAVINVDNTYHEDSFCVRSGDENNSSEELSELEIAERILKERKKAKKNITKRIGSKNRRRILVDSSDSD